MRKTLIILLPLLFASALIVWIGVNKVNHMSDFQRLTVRASSAIIGTSRASRLSDSTLNSELGYDYSTVYNLAFNNGVSPYGPFYNDFLTNKIETFSDSLNLFILCIDPWSLSENMEISDKPEKFREAQSIITFKQKEDFSAVRYFFNHYKKSPFTLFMPTKEGYAHYEVAPPESLSKKITAAKIASYQRRHVRKKKLNQIRIESFIELVSYLSEKGQVILVRLPVSKEMKELEETYIADFNQLIKSLMTAKNTYFLDFYPYNSNFECPDGDHLLKKDAIKISQMIAEISVLIENQSIDISGGLLEAYLEVPEAQFSTFLQQ